MSPNQQVLMVDDDQHDIFLTERAFKRAQWSGHFNSVTSGQELFEYLGIAENDSSNPDGSTTTLPDVLLLDLNMPGINGFDVLKRIRNTERLAHLPVIVLSTSESSDDVLRAYQLGANSYISKPYTPVEMTELATLFKNYWFELTRLPNSFNSTH